MKFNNIFLIIIVLVFSSCTIDGDPVVSDNSNSVATWHLIKSENPTMGTLSSFDLDTITWVFFDTQGAIRVENNNTDDTKYDLLDSGTYNYSEPIDGNENFIYINQVEYSININENTFTLHDKGGTSLSSGEALEGGIIYTFQRVLSAQ